MSRMTGDHFVLFKRNDGLWHWKLQGSHHPHDSITQSTQGYRSPSAAKKSMKSARTAMRGAVDDNGNLRIEKWKKSN